MCIILSKTDILIQFETNGNNRKQSFLTNSLEFMYKTLNSYIKNILYIQLLNK